MFFTLLKDVGALSLRNDLSRYLIFSNASCDMQATLVERTNQLLNEKAVLSLKGVRIASFYYVLHSLSVFNLSCPPSLSCFDLI